MKIALTCPASLPATQFGGILFLSIHIAKNLSDAGHNLTIYTSDLDFANNASTFNKKLPSKEKIENYSIKRTHVWFSTFLFFVNPGMYKQMMDDEIDIIHAIGVRSFQAFIAAIVSKQKKIPLVISDQGGLTTHPDLKKSSLIKKFLIKLQDPLIKFIIKQATKVIVANEYEKNIFKNFCDNSKISIVKNGIDLNELYSSNTNFSQKYSINKKFILFLGRFHEVKGVDTLLDSIKLIKNNILLNEIKFIIMGVDFGYQSKIEKMIKDYDLFEKISLIEKPPRQDVISAYDQCEFLVLPSKWELSPLTTAHGIPFTIKHNENCILVEPQNPKELSTAILDLLENEEKREKLGKSGYDLVHRECNSEQMTKETMRIYEQLIKDN